MSKEDVGKHSGTEIGVDDILDSDEQELVIRLSILIMSILRDVFCPHCIRVRCSPHNSFFSRLAARNELYFQSVLPLLTISSFNIETPWL